MSPLDQKPIHLRIFSVPSHLPVVRATVEKMARRLGFDSDISGAVMLSVDEALTNIIRHAYGGADDKIIEIELTPICGDRPEGLEISLRDYGRTVEPSQICSRDLQDVRPGGLGVHIMNECMDELEYTHPEGGGTLLTMVKRLSSAKQEVQ